MPTKIYEGGARARQMTITLTVGSFANTETFITTINGKSITYTADGTGSTTTVAAAIQALLASSDAPPEFQEITFTQVAAVITGVAKTAGKPFTLTKSGTGTYTLATTVANIGPAVWSEATNWSGGAIPANGDDVHIDPNCGGIKYDLDNATMMALALASLNIPAAMEDQIGLPEINKDSASLPYGEYRSTYLRFTVPPTTTNIGEGEGDGSGMVKLDLGQTANAATTTVNVYQTGTSDVDDLEACLLKFTFTGTGLNVLNVSRGSVGVAVLPGEVTTFNTTGSFRVGYQTSQESDAQVRCGSGVTFPTNAVSGTCLKTGGKLTVSSNLTTLNHKGGDTTVLGTAAVTTLNHDKGTIRWDSAGTITALNGGSDAVIDFNGNPRPKTITTLTVNEGFKLIDDQGVVTVTNAIAATRLDLVVRVDGAELRFGPGRSITVV